MWNADIIGNRKRKGDYVSNKKRIILLTILLSTNLICSTSAFEETEETEAQTMQETTVEQFADEMPNVWSETYTYLSDTNEPHAVVDTIEKSGISYTLQDVQYQVTELTDKFLQKSEEMWAYAAYEPEQELEKEGIQYTLTALSKEEQTQSGRTQSIVQYRTYLEGQEIPETLDVEIQDEVTGEIVYGTISKAEQIEDGADWKEGGLEQWEMYSWDGNSWFFEQNGETFFATDQSPWFEGCERVLLQDLKLDTAFNQITEVEWYGDGWQDEEGNWKRSVRIVGNRMVPRYQVMYSGDVAETDLPIVRYIAQYTSAPQGYLVEVRATYKKAILRSDPKLDDFTSVQQLQTQFSGWEEVKISEKKWYLLLTILVAVSVGLQGAVIFVLAIHRK